MVPDSSTSPCITHTHEFYLHSCIATLLISILQCVCLHTHLSLWVCSYTNSKILQRVTYENLQKYPYFLIYYDYTLVLVYKINMSIYSMYGHILNVYTIINVLVWSYTSHPYSLLGQIHHTSWDTHIGVATSECKKKFFLYIITACMYKYLVTPIDLFKTTWNSSARSLIAS